MDISSMLEVQVDEVKETDSKENVTPREQHPSTTNVAPPISQEEFAFYKLLFGNDVSSIRFHRLHCTACDAHIGSAPAEAHNMFEHPVLRTLLCAKCRDFYGDGNFEQGDDATDMFCRWCANGGNLYCCSFCSNTFCYKCIKRNFDPILRKKIEADEKWKCFVCDPTDLYGARATCWALLQHVQALNGLFQNNGKMSKGEIDVKMFSDESKCCPRRKKRKRRRNFSNSEEDESENYVPKQEIQDIIPKRRKRGRKSKFSNGSNVSMSEKHNELSDDSSLDHCEILPSLLSCEQTMVECENATVSGDGRIISQASLNTVCHRVNPPSSTRQPTMYNAPIMNVVSDSNVLQGTPPLTPFRHDAPDSMPEPNQANQMHLYQTVHPTPVPMVTIPNRNINILSRSRFSLPESQYPRIMSRVNVIEVESDTDDVTVVGPSVVGPVSRTFSNNNKAVPVALVSSKNNHATVRRQEVPERRTVKTLNQRLLPHGKEVNDVLSNLLTKFQGLFKETMRDEYKRHDLSDARSLIKQFHREIRGTVTQLACINDRIVREYNKWKRHQTQFSDMGNHKRIKSEEIPLDMTCINESDSDADIGNAEEYSIISPSELVSTANVCSGLNLFKAKNTVDRAVGDHPAALVDKSIQINDAELIDYEKFIRHSTLKLENSTNASTSNIQQFNNQFRSYEECFIEFLQGAYMQDENAELRESNETSLKDLTEANSPFVSEMLEAIDESVTPSRGLSISVRKESDLKPSQVQLGGLITSKAVNNLVKMVSNINDDTDRNTNEVTDNKQGDIETRKKHFPTSGGTCIVNVSEANRQNLSRSIAINSESSNEDDCTIIDD
ncbi:uncharacterized protein LOC143429853 [Xylocopa sonorina]|uniref:uncharacterized protein LOC143429853 n=1 Tax=Xylocopa sonorina TaxID=1818115 RepID=UPI00403A97A5